MKKIRIFALVFALIIIFSTVANAVSSDKNGKLICVADGGYCEKYEKNSPEAIEAACDLGVEMVSVDVKKIFGGELVLDEKNETPLRYVIEDYSDRIIFVVNNAQIYKDDIFRIINETNTFDRVILRIERNYKDIASWLKEKEGYNLKIISRYKGNIIFNVAKELKQVKNNSDYVELGTSNINGVIFNSMTDNNYFYENYFKGINKFISMTNKKLCGNREDSVMYWDELCSLGFNMFETSKPDEFMQYKKHSEVLFSKLEKECKKAEKISTEKYSTESKTALEKSLKNCNELISKNIMSINSLDLALTQLKNAEKNLTKSNGHEKGEWNFSTGRIITAISILVLFVVVQLYFYGKRKKADK